MTTANPLSEPAEAFPYTPPTDEIRKKYNEIFELKEALNVPFPKLMFDKVVAFIILVFCLPVILLLLIINFLEGVLIPENRGPLFFYYNAVSGGKVFKKWKIRLIKENTLIRNCRPKATGMPIKKNGCLKRAPIWVLL